jgi:hypothetical protein
MIDHRISWEWLVVLGRADIGHSGHTYCDNQSLANNYDGDGNPTFSQGRSRTFDALCQMTYFGPAPNATLKTGYNEKDLKAPILIADAKWFLS